MGVHLGGQVELGVGRIAIGVTPVAIGEAFHLDLSEDGGELAAMARLHRPMVDTLGADDLLGTSFTKGTQVELSLEHLAQQFPAAAVELVLQLTVAERGGLAALEPSHQLLEGLPRPAERHDVGGSSGRGHAHRLRRRSTRRARKTPSPSSAWVSSTALAEL